MKIGVISLGCAKNQVDTERMLGLLAPAGYAFTEDPAQAEVLIVNTCGFIDPAKEESINSILEMAQYKQTGIADRNPAFLQYRGKTGKHLCGPGGHPV